LATRGGQHGDLDADHVHHLIGKGGIVGDQDRLRGGIVLGLAEQVGRDPLRIVLGIGNHQDFRGPATMSIPTTP
jgi:hypothetical protein